MTRFIVIKSIISVSSLLNDLGWESLQMQHRMSMRDAELLTDRSS